MYRPVPAHHSMLLLWLVACLVSLVCAQNSSTVICSQSVGLSIFTNPTANSIVLINSVINVTWKYSSVNTARYPNSTVVLYYAQGSQDGSQLKYKEFGRTKNRTDTWFLWTVPNAADGVYTIRLAPDDIDQYGQVGTSKCTPEGFPNIASVSASFVNVRSANTDSKSVDNYGPNSGTTQTFSLNNAIFALIMIIDPC
ncbi:hypothetical protein HK096_004124 [Nowakowskiella sp. JEL0078]|nr:hypothetical protein HK096_004124 [Nowakowskiella sp. JEL0078]